MKITIDGPQFAAAIQAAEWVAEVEGIDAILAAGEAMRQHIEAVITRETSLL